MASRRVERMSRVLKQAVSAVIVAELSDPRMGFITVTEVDPSPDLKTAKVKVSILGTEAVMRRTMQGLRAATGFVQREVAGKVSLRKLPCAMPTVHPPKSAVVISPRE